MARDISYTVLDLTRKLRKLPLARFTVHCITILILGLSQVIRHFARKLRKHPMAFLVVANEYQA